MPELCFVINCNFPGDDEYTYMEYVPALEREFPVTWKLCASHCEFAIDVVETISNLEEIMKTPSCHKCGAVAGATYGGKDVCPECFLKLKEMERKA